MGRHSVRRWLSILMGISVLFVYLFTAGSGAEVRAEETASSGVSAPSETPTPTPVKDVALSNLIEGWPQMGDINELSGLLIDADNGGVLYSLNRDLIRYPASTTKVLTALLVIENTRMNDVVTMTDTGIQMVVGGSANAQTVAGEEFTVEQCLYILLLKSANDIANQLAEFTGGSMAHFVEMMNERAAELGCTNTHFTNPSGMPDSEHYSTAEDMALIMRAAVQNETFLKIAGTERITIPPTNKTAESRTYTNHNALLVKDSGYYYEYCIAGKTGYTDAAWRTYVAAARRDGRTLICVLMKGPDRTDFVDAANLFDYGFDNFEKLEVPGGSVNLPLGRTVAETTDETEKRLTDGSLNVKFYFNKLPVGSAVMTEAEYASLRPSEGEGGGAGAGQASGGNGGVVTLVLVLLFAAILVGSFLLYQDYRQKKLRAARRRKAAAAARRNRAGRR